jgi:hypothetical protein
MEFSPQQRESERKIQRLFNRKIGSTEKIGQQKKAGERPARKDRPLPGFREEVENLDSGQSGSCWSQKPDCSWIS